MAKGERTEIMMIGGSLANDPTQNQIIAESEHENVVKQTLLESVTPLEYLARRRELKNAWLTELVKRNSW